MVLAVQSQSTTSTKSEYTKVKGLDIAADIASSRKLTEALRKFNIGYRIDGSGIVIDITHRSLFQFDRANLSNASRDELIALKTLIDKYASSKPIDITGHTDSFGTDAYNQKLSERRVLSVKRQLQNLGFSKGRVITTCGKGERELIVASGDQKAQAVNRRVELTVRMHVAQDMIGSSFKPKGDGRLDDIHQPKLKDSLNTNQAQEVVKKLLDAGAKFYAKNDGIYVVLQNTSHFDFDKSNPKQESDIELKNIGRVIKDLKFDGKVEIHGHTDSYGTDAYNNKLSIRRAESVKNRLLNIQGTGIKDGQIETKGFGESNLIVSGSATKDQQAPNRRVELKLDMLIPDYLVKQYGRDKLYLYFAERKIENSIEKQFAQLQYSWVPNKDNENTMNNGLNFAFWKGDTMACPLLRLRPYTNLDVKIFNDGIYGKYTIRELLSYIVRTNPGKEGIEELKMYLSDNQKHRDKEGHFYYNIDKNKFFDWRFPKDTEFLTGTGPSGAVQFDVTESGKRSK